jgi:predicted O-methyltransferase YrrM
MTVDEPGVHQREHDAEFDVVIRAIDGVDGWLTIDQARRLWQRARTLRAGDSIVEIGSFRGRSTITLALGAPADVSIVAIDPHAGSDRGPQEISGDAIRGDDDHSVFLTNLERAGVGDRVRHVRKFSDDALEDVDGSVTLLFIDGAHRYGPARADIDEWGRRVDAGGSMLIHDAFSSIGVTLAILRELALSSEFTYCGRTGSLAEYRREHLSGRARRAHAVRQMGALPWFARNLLVKALISVGLRRATRLLGNEQEWPY